MWGLILWSELQNLLLLLLLSPPLHSNKPQSNSLLCWTPLTWFWCLQRSGRFAVLQEDQQCAEEVDGGGGTAAVPATHFISTLVRNLRSI